MGNYRIGSIFNSDSFGTFSRYWNETVDKRSDCKRVGSEIIVGEDAIGRRQTPMGRFHPHEIKSYAITEGFY